MENGKIIILLGALMALISFASVMFGDVIGTIAKFIAVSGVVGLIVALQAGRYEAKHNGKGYRNGMLSDVLNWLSIALTFFCIGAIGSYFYERNSLPYNIVISGIGFSSLITTLKVANYAYKVIGSSELPTDE